MKALFTYDYGQEKMERVAALGYDVVVRSEKELVIDNELEDVEVLVCYNPFETLAIDEMRDLKLIMVSSIGIDQVPIDIVKPQNIMLTNNKGGYSIPIGEWIVTKVLEIYKGSKGFIRLQDKKVWRMDTSILELTGKTIGFIGTGTIAHEAAKRLKAFGVKIHGVNTNGRSVVHFDKCYSMDRLGDFLSVCDVVVVTIPLTEKTHGLINKSSLADMKDDSVFINVSRGDIVDEVALLDALGQGKFRGVALDVFEHEPLEVESPFWDIERVHISPHNCWMSEYRNERRFETIIENLRRYNQAEVLLNVVDIDKGY